MYHWNLLIFMLINSLLNELVIPFKKFYGTKSFFNRKSRDIFFEKCNRKLSHTDHRHLSLSQDEDFSGQIPRLNEDIPALLDWVSANGGQISSGITIQKSKEGWSLMATQSLHPGEQLAKIPKKLCIFSTPDQDSGLLPNTVQLINSLHPSHWRVRLAIAILSERVRPDSFYQPYISNLPFEFWGMPMFFNSSEFDMIQDPSLMLKQSDRSKFLIEFTNDALLPLYRSKKDPFSNHKPSVDALGWAFAAASSRAFRSPSLVQENNQVLIPYYDILSHSASPNCQVVLSESGSEYILLPLEPIVPGAELTISYGKLSNEELFGDYGFSVDENYDGSMSFKFDSVLLDLARNVMGQGDSIKKGSSDYSVHIGRSNSKFDERWLSQWQTVWVKALNLSPPWDDYTMKLTGKEIDGRAYAYLRVLYSHDETELTDHGYTPQSLQHNAAVVSPRTEREVIRTLIGIIGILLSAYRTTLRADLFALKSGSSYTINENKFEYEDIVSFTRKNLRLALNIPPPLSDSPTVRKLQILESIFGKNDLGEGTMESLLDNRPMIESLLAQINSKEEGNSIEKSNKADVKSEESINVSELGNSLSPNIREILKYRIRKKEAYRAIIRDLSKRFHLLLGSNENASDYTADILPDIRQEKAERSAKISELLTELLNKDESKAVIDEKSDLLILPASDISNKWADKGLSL